MSYHGLHDENEQRAAEERCDRGLRELQAQVATWVSHNFPDADRTGVALGLCEEAGEVARAVLKQAQGIRGTHEEWDAEIRKEIADVVIKACDVARACGFDLADAVAHRWADVSRRDWRRDAQGHGIGGAA